MKTLDEMIAELPLDRQEAVRKRAEWLIAGELERRQKVRGLDEQDVVQRARKFAASLPELGLPIGRDINFTYTSPLKPQQEPCPCNGPCGNAACPKPKAG